MSFGVYGLALLALAALGAARAIKDPRSWPLTLMVGATSVIFLVIIPYYPRYRSPIEPVDRGSRRDCAADFRRAATGPHSAARNDGRRCDELPEAREDFLMLRAQLARHAIAELVEVLADVVASRRATAPGRPRVAAPGLARHIEALDVDVAGLRQIADRRLYRAGRGLAALDDPFAARAGCRRTPARGTCRRRPCGTS